MGLDLATMRSVAERAGVSQTTVSRILAGQRQYASETVDRVLAAADHLKYRPNSLVRGILTGRTRCVGVMVPAFGRFYGPMVEGTHDALCEAGHVMIVTWNKLSLPAADDTTELALIHRLVEQRVDGIILRPMCDEATQAYFEEIWQRRLPLVAVDRDLPGVRADFVGTDDAAGAAAAAGHLLGLGHRHVAVVTGAQSVSTFRDRRMAFETAVAAAGGMCRALTVAQQGAKASGLGELLSGPDVPTAVFCTADDYAPSVYQAAADAGLVVPADLSVVGFADHDFCSWMQPPLTTVRQQPYEIGRRAAELLLQRCDQNRRPAEPAKLRLVPELVVRGSTAMAKARPRPRRRGRQESNR